MEMTDVELIEELKKRLKEKDLALIDLRETTTNLEKVNGKLQESENIKSNFLSNIRNEINNPLTTLVNISGELADMHDFEKKKLKGLAAMLHSEALYLDFQMRNILTAADLEAGEAEVSITKVDINSLVDSCIQSLVQLIDERGITLKKDGPDDIWVNTDYDKLFISLLNLLSNAVIFNNDKGVIEIKYGKEKGSFVCSVIDHGLGIKPEDQKIIFDQFKQLDSGTRKQYRGHGLGLSVTKAVADFMVGTITVESKSGKGSVFTLTLPDRPDEEVEGISSEGIELFIDEPGDEQEF